MEDNKYTYDYPMPAITADMVVFKKVGGRIFVLVVKRKNDPYKGLYALPGGFMEMDERTLECAKRELEEETGVKVGDRPIELVTVMDDPDRDSRGRVVSVVYVTTVSEDTEPVAGDDAEEAIWVPALSVLSGKIELAFDHREAVKAADMKLWYSVWC